ncbi:MAG: BON domain-containing protein [Gallionellaceae bacterium]|nr:BON domain-containing protein [Gallionellaceae bacterium]
MKVLESLKLACISVLLAAGLTACDKPGPAETAGKKIDQAAENTGKKIEQTAEDAGKKMGEATDKATLKMAEQSYKAGVVIDDAEITAKVKAAIFAEPGLKTLQISVDTVKGIVTLSGSVNTQQNSDSAKALAGAVSGVKEVENKLALKPSK